MTITLENTYDNPKCNSSIFITEKDGVVLKLYPSFFDKRCEFGTEGRHQEIWKTNLDYFIKKIEEYADTIERNESRSSE